MEIDNVSIRSARNSRDDSSQNPNDYQVLYVLGFGIYHTFSLFFLPRVRLKS